MPRRTRTPSSVRSNGATPRPSFEITTGEAASRELKTSEAVARDIVHQIVMEERRPGDRLPSESAMLEQYGVSRQSLREGLRLLEVEGLITLKRGPGGGPVVGHLDPANLGRTATLYYHLAGATYAELLEAWVVTESALAERAALHPDREVVRKAMEPFLHDEVHEEDDEVASAMRHARFHGVVASLARNRVLELSFQSMGQIVLHHVVLSSDPRAIEAEILGDHTALAKAITAGHARKARSLMEEHITRMADFYARQVRPDRAELIDWR